MSVHLSRRRFLTKSAAAGAAIGVGGGRTGAEVTATGSATTDRTALQTVVDEIVEAELATHDATGAVVAVVRDGSVALTRGYGETPFDGSEVTADETPVQAGSVSKSITFTAAMQLVDRGAVAADDDVNDHLESVTVPDTYDEPITLEHLATHTAGLENRIRNETVGDLAHRQSLETALRTYRPERIHPPGELLAYTNYAATLTGQLVADVAESSFQEYAAANVFDPLGMDRSTFEPIPTHLDAETRERLREFLPWHSNGPPSSGLWTTGSDMAQFMLAHLNGGATPTGRVLSDAATRAMHRRWYTPHEAFDGMAFGFFERHRGDVRLLTHDGDGPGYRTSLVLVPELDLGLFVSFVGEQPGSGVWAVQEAILDRYVPTTENEPSPDGRPERADDLEGTYRELHAVESRTYEKSLFASFYVPDTDVRIEDDGTLVTAGATTKRWVEIDPLVFRRVDGEQTLVFHETDGEITALSVSAVPYGEYSARAINSVPRTLVPVAGYEEVTAQTALAFGSSVAVLSGVVGWPLVALVRRYRGAAGPDSNRSRRARWSAGGAGALLFGFLGAVIVLAALTSVLDVPGLFDRPPRGFGLLFVLPIAATAATLVAGGYAVTAWREEFWSLPARVHYSVVVGGLVGLLWLFWYWNLLGVPTG